MATIKDSMSASYPLDRQNSRCGQAHWPHGTSDWHGRSVPLPCPPKPQGRRNQVLGTLGITGLALTLWMIIAGCSVTRKPSPGATLATRRSRQIARLVHRLDNCAVSNQARQRADRSLAMLLGAQSPIRLAALTYILHTTGQSSAMRIYALQQIFTANRTLAAALLKKYLPTWQQWPVLFYAGKVCAQCHDPRLVGPLILSLNRPAVRYQLSQRPEAVAIRDITGQSLRQVLTGTLLQPGSMEVRIAALALLRQEKGPAFVRQFLQHAAGDDPMISAMQWWIRHYRHVSVSTTEILWTQELYVEKRSPMMIRCAGNWRQLRGYVRRHTLTPAQAYMLAHLHVTPADITRSGLLQAIAAELRHQKHLRRPRPYPHAPGYPNPSLQSNAPRLTLLDMILLQDMLCGLSHSAFRQMVYRDGLRSMHNHASETGGLICYAHIPAGLAFTTPRTAEKSLTLHIFPPLLNRDSGVYVSSPMLLAATVHALAEFIFHFQHVHNARYVGPAVGDLAYVRRTRCAVVIFTSVARRAFDATLDLPNGAVVDLGIFHVHSPAMPSGG
ncbi:MAG: hypothetical protein HKL95_04300 [Phycisphaerae bacterium]|nr:hypothetical protein [Phycisphaerae bacterium]